MPNPTPNEVDEVIAEENRSLRAEMERQRQRYQWASAAHAEGAEFLRTPDATAQLFYRNSNSGLTTAVRPEANGNMSGGSEIRSVVHELSGDEYAVAPPSETLGIATSEQRRVFQNVTLEIDDFAPLENVFTTETPLNSITLADTITSNQSPNVQILFHGNLDIPDPPQPEPPTNRENYVVLMVTTDGFIYTQFNARPDFAEQLAKEGQQMYGIQLVTPHVFRLADILAYCPEQFKEAEEPPSPLRRVLKPKT